MMHKKANSDEFLDVGETFWRLCPPPPQRPKRTFWIRQCLCGCVKHNLHDLHCQNLVCFTYSIFFILNIPSVYSCNQGQQIANILLISYVNHVDA